MNDLPRMLQGLTAAHALANPEFLPLAYSDLCRVAAARMAHESRGHTLQPAALVHEAWLRLGADRQPLWQNRAHFFAAISETMRRILIDHARKRLALRRGGGVEHVNIDDVEVAAPEARDRQLVAVDEALAKFAIAEPRKAALVKLRYFGGLTLEEAAAALDIPDGTAKRWWTYARAWFFREIKN